MAIDISYVIINYNDAGNLGRAVDSALGMAAAAGLTGQALVVDNGSSDDSAAVLAEAAERHGEALEAIFLETNTGTTYSRNRALERAAGRIICVMDSDAELLGQDLASIDQLLGDLPEVGIVGPAIIMPDGSTYDSVKLFPTLTDKLLKLPNIFLSTGQINHDWYHGFPFDRIRTVDTAISCCWFFRRELFGLLGPLDERIFYAPEDVDYCLRCWKAGRAVVYYPRYRVLHHTKQISHKSPLSATALSHLKGLFYYWSKHRYLLSRGGLHRRFGPLAEGLDQRLAGWEAARWPKGGGVG